MNAAVVDVAGVDLSFGGVQVLREVTLEFHEGESVGLVGPNGAGKTSLLNCLSGVYRPSRGAISVLGHPTHGLRPHRIAALGVARTFQAGLNLAQMSLLEFVLLGRHRHHRHGVGSYALGLPWLLRQEEPHRAKAKWALEFVGLHGMGLRALEDLPYGVVKLADVARALASEPRVILLDEPASGLGAEARVEVGDALRRVRTELGITEVLVEHDMALVQRICERLVVLAEGSVLRDGVPGVVLADPAVATVFLGGEVMTDQQSTDVAG